MRGSNDLVLNEATMIEAVQFWLDSKMVKQAPKVTSVKHKGNCYDSSFTVSLDADADRSDQKQNTA